MRIYAKIIILALLATAGSTSLSAQFTIERKETAGVETIPGLKELPDIKLESGYFDPAAWKAKKRLERRERNTVQFDASLQTSMQRYENWSASVDNNFQMLASVFFRHQYKRDKFSVDYKIEAYYGMNMVSDSEAEDRRDNFFKNKDEFRVNLNMGWAMRRNWAYSATANFRSQFSEGYPKRKDYTLASNFMAPGYVDVAVGFTHKVNDKPFRITLSPLSGSVTMVLDKRIWESVADGGSKYGVKKNERYTGHIGPSAEIFFEKQFGKRKNFRYRSTLYGFTAYSKPMEYPLVRWDNTFEIKLMRFISAQIYAQAYYKKEDVDHVQYQYSFSIGLTYNFKNK